MPRVSASGPIMASHSRSTLSSAVGSIDSDSLPDSISARSRISLIKSSRYQPACSIWPMLRFCDGVGAGVPDSINCANPRMADRGVRSSWLMLERKSVFAWLALSATCRAVDSSLFFSCNAAVRSWRSVSPWRRSVMLRIVTWMAGASSNTVAMFCTSTSIGVPSSLSSTSSITGEVALPSRVTFFTRA